MNFFARAFAWGVLAVGLPALGAAAFRPELWRELWQYPPPTPAEWDPPGSPIFVAALLASFAALVAAWVIGARARRDSAARGDVREASHAVGDNRDHPGSAFDRWTRLSPTASLDPRTTKHPANIFLLASMLWLAIAWLLAWTRFEWFAPWQRYTFTPLWLGYIATANALALRITSACPATSEPRLFALLFPVSAGFWWYFEYLNRFVQNWIYPGLVHTSSLEYAIHASICFSTVLPAVFSTAWLLERVATPVQRRWSRGPRLAFCGRSAWPWWMLGAAGAFALGAQPELAFPLVWIAPGALWLALDPPARRVWADELARGEWQRWLTWACAALICGFFWEMWNYFSAEQWLYRVPHAELAHVFEMPLAGYLGYLPFGIVCGLTVEALHRRS